MNGKRLGPIAITFLALLGFSLLYFISTMSSSTLLLNIKSNHNEDQSMSECLYNKTKDVTQNVAINAAIQLCCSKYCKTLFIDKTNLSNTDRSMALLNEVQDKEKKCSSNSECCQCYK